MSPDVSDTGSKGLLAAAALVLRAHGFSLRTVSLEALSMQMLLAENELFLIGLVEFAGAEQLALIEGAAALELADRLDAVAGKRWDAYLVLVTDAPAADQALSLAVADILYNTRYVRRLIRWDLNPFEEDLTTALKTFLPLPPGTGDASLDQSRLMLERVVAYGVPREQAQEAFELWRATDNEAEGDEDD